MKTLLFVLSAVAALLLPTEASACNCCNHHGSHASAHPAAATAPLAEGEARVTIPVTAMDCGHCASRVEAALAKLTGVKVADASFDSGQVVVVFENSKTRPAKPVEAINGLGLKARVPVLN
jgi:copper chaperone CopZ